MNACANAKPEPFYEFSIAQRAALHILDHALAHVAGQATAAGDSTVKLQAALDAGKILWQCRELVLCAAEHRRYQGGAQ